MKQETWTDRDCCSWTNSQESWVDSLDQLKVCGTISDVLWQQWSICRNQSVPGSWETLDKQSDPAVPLRNTLMTSQISDPQPRFNDKLNVPVYQQQTENDILLRMLAVPLSFYCESIWKIITENRLCRVHYETKCSLPVFQSIGSFGILQSRALEYTTNKQIKLSEPLCSFLLCPLCLAIS